MSFTKVVAHHKLRNIIIRVTPSRNYSRPPHFLGGWGCCFRLCISPQGCSWPKHPVTKLLGSLWGTKIALGVGVNLISYLTYSCLVP